MAACYLLLNLTEKKRNFWRHRWWLSHDDLLCSDQQFLQKLPKNCRYLRNRKKGDNNSKRCWKMDLKC